ncbi:Uma2 family endonuclease [Herbidospora cretacea]|uniref:Uma2 family endonuclease n=1 Tax=Herbidospora cretacea TaxID=28444 RepID=UPI001C3F2FB4|nr:Uma2 family endonuclease [Herbidospora cretacea]
MPADWFHTITPQPHPLTLDEYRLLPGDLRIEIIDGYVAHRPDPSPGHQAAARGLADLLEKHAREAMNRGYGCLTVNTSVDLWLRDLPLHVRRPDVALFRCLNGDGTLRPVDVVLVAEIVEAGSETTDTCDKHTEYARAGILHYWIVRLDSGGIALIERYRLDPATMAYRHIGTLMRDEGGSPEISAPIAMVIDWPELPGSTPAGPG